MNKNFQLREKSLVEKNLKKSDFLRTNYLFHKVRKSRSYRANCL